MTWDVVLEEDGVVTLPEELLARPGFERGAVLEMIGIDGAIHLRPVAATDRSICA